MVIPIHDINPLRRRPVVTWLLIAANVVVFALFTPVSTSVAGTETSARDVCEQQRFFQQWGAIPREMLTGEQLSVVNSGRVAVNARGEVGCLLESPPTFDKAPVLSVVTSMFLHGSWVHLLGNMLFLGVFGNNIEDRMGRLRYLLFYLACGFAAAYGFALFEGRTDTDTLIGASGAVAGVLGAYILLFPRAKVIGLVSVLFFLPFWLPAWIVLGFWFALQYLYFIGIGVAQGGDVAYSAHVVGFVFGALVVWPFIRRLRAAGPPARPVPTGRWRRQAPTVDPGYYYYRDPRHHDPYAGPRHPDSRHPDSWDQDSWQHDSWHEDSGPDDFGHEGPGYGGSGRRDSRHYDSRPRDSRRQGPRHRRR